MSRQNASYTIDMCSGPMSPKIFKFAIPVMLSGVLQLLFNAADIIVVSRFCGDNSMAAVGSTSSLINLIIGLFIGISTATNIIAARLLGERNYKKLYKVVHTSILISIICGIFLTIIGVLFSHKVLVLMGTPDEVLKLSENYIKIYFSGATASLVYNFGSSLLRANGDTKRPMYIIILAGFINFVLNVVLVSGVGMNVEGVAIATVISQVVSATLVVLCLMADEGHIRLNIRELRIYKAELFEIIKMGLPAGLQGMLFSISNVTIQSAVNSLGKTTMAAYTAALSINGFLYVSCNAFYQSNMTFTSQNMGANKWERVKQSLYIHLLYEIAIGLFIGILTYLFAIPLLNIYTKDANVAETGVKIMKYISLPIFLCGLGETIMGGLRGLGITSLTTVVAFLGSCLTNVLWIVTVFAIFPTHDILFAIYPISWTLTAIAHSICFIIMYPRMKNKAPARLQN